MSLEQLESLNPLKKINQSCFYGQPDYIRWLTVDADGGAWFSINRPEIGENSFFSEGDDFFFLGDGYDSANWQNSAIERISPKNSFLSWSHISGCEKVYDLKQAIEIYVRDCNHNDEEPLEIVKMHAFKHKSIDPNWFAEDVLETLLLRLDEEHGDPEEFTEATQEMKDAALAFVRAVSAEYRVWQVEPVGQVEIRISDYWSES